MYLTLVRNCRILILVKNELKIGISIFSDVFWVSIFDPPDPGRICGHYFHAYCLSAANAIRAWWVTKFARLVYYFVICLSDVWDFSSDLPEHSLKIYKSDQHFRYLLIHQNTSAREVVMLALREFGISECSSNFTLCEVTVEVRSICDKFYKKSSRIIILRS